jgi:FtsZ-interacting cell division protein ZipA
METNLIIIILVLVAVIALIIYLIIQNKKDAKDLMRHLIDEDSISLSKKHDNDENDEVAPDK